FLVENSGERLRPTTRKLLHLVQVTDGFPVMNREPPCPLDNARHRISSNIALVQGVLMYRRFSVAALVLSALVAAAYGQLNTATVTGTVTDPTGAPVPNVRVVVVQTETNFESSTVTNSEGLYRVPSLQPGSYRVTFEAAGFKRLVHSGLDLRVGDVAPLNVHLEIGQLTESIQVSAQGTLLQTGTSSTGP